MTDMEDNTLSTIEMTTDVVAAYLSNNTVSAAELPGLIQSIHQALTAVASGGAPAPVAAPEPPVSIRRSLTPDFLICLEDGRKFKSLKRHLRTKFDMSPEDYRAKWGLPKDYPMVAPNYAKTRSDLARAIGLGQGGRQPKKAKA
jgi:predicted transcriptional regulator